MICLSLHFFFQYGVSLKAEPDHKTLGLRLKGAFKDVTKEIKLLTDDQLTEFIKTGHMKVSSPAQDHFDPLKFTRLIFQVLGHDIGPEDLRLMHTFEGSGQTDKYEAHSDNNILILLDCTPDQVTQFFQ